MYMYIVYASTCILCTCIYTMYICADMILRVHSFVSLFFCANLSLCDTGGILRSAQDTRAETGLLCGWQKK